MFLEQCQLCFQISSNGILSVLKDIPLGEDVKRRDSRRRSRREQVIIQFLNISRMWEPSSFFSGARILFHMQLPPCRSATFS